MARARLRLLVEQQASSLDPALQTTARILVEQLGAGDIQARAIQGLGNLGLHSDVFFVRTGNAQVILGGQRRSEEHTSELQSLMRISYAVFCLKNTTTPNNYIDRLQKH